MAKENCLKKKRTYLFIGIPILLLLLFFSILNHPIIAVKEASYRYLSGNINTLLSYLYPENIEVIDTLNIPELKIEISDNNLKHLDTLYDEYVSKRLGYIYYAKHNYWFEAKLWYKNECYDVLIKAHGKRPDYQKSAQYISLNVLLKGKKEINGMDRFNLIIYERININYDRLKILAESFHLMYQRDELVKVKINKNSNKLFFLETRMNNDYLESIGKSSLIRIERDFHKSMIYSDGDTLETLNAAIKEEVSKIKCPVAMQEKIIERYTSINRKLETGESDSIEQYFDLDYISSFEAMRFVGGYDGHGFTHENLLVYFDTLNFKFYPIYHRDNFQTDLSDKNVYEQLNIWYPFFYGDYDFKGIQLPLLICVSQNEKIKKTTQEKIKAFTSLHAKQIDEEFKMVDSFHKQLHKNSLPFDHSLGFSDPSPLLNNVSILKQQFNF